MNPTMQAACFRIVSETVFKCHSVAIERHCPVAQVVQCRALLEVRVFLSRRNQKSPTQRKVIIPCPSESRKSYLISCSVALQIVFRLSVTCDVHTFCRHPATSALISSLVIFVVRRSRTGTTSSKHHTVSQEKTSPFSVLQYLWQMLSDFAIFF